MKNICIHTGSVYHAAGQDVTAVGGELIAVVLAADVCHFCVKTEFDAVCGSIFCECNVQTERADNAAGRTVDGSDDFLGEVRLHLMNFVLHLRSGYPGFCWQCPARRGLPASGGPPRRSRRSGNRFCGIQNPALWRRFHQFISRTFISDIRVRVYSRYRVDDGAVGFGSAAADVLLFFHNTNGERLYLESSRAQALPETPAPMITTSYIVFSSLKSHADHTSFLMCFSAWLSSLTFNL